MFVGLVALGAVAFDVTWFFVRHIMVMAHEGAHAVAASLLFRGVNGITLKANGDGKTEYGAGGRLSEVAIKSVGYVGPSASGFGTAELIGSGHIAAVLWVALVLLAVLLLALRMSFGIITVILAGALVFFVGRYTPMRTQVIAAYAITWLLLLSGVRIIIEHGLKSDDGTKLRGLTGIPHLIWSLLWLAGSIAAVAVAGQLLVMRA